MTCETHSPRATYRLWNSQFRPRRPSLPFLFSFSSSLILECLRARVSSVGIFDDPWIFRESRPPPRFIPAINSKSAARWSVKRGLRVSDSPVRELMIFWKLATGSLAFHVCSLFSLSGRATEVDHFSVSAVGLSRAVYFIFEFLISLISYLSAVPATRWKWLGCLWAVYLYIFLNSIKL